ncbi:molybdopterin-guanine dinucleotide biosynthesis protein B [Evansella sp. AB-rgal1]|uniref:molybdopterin-guanine dinucleotide biosynthesis protein B n=1 Tax=Evansella sp. AB-rgal1 TaxID=3242696 RepID=UPI00359D1241
MSFAVFQIVGFSNSGKTTLVTKWLKRLSEEGYSAVTIKHHGHGEELKVVDVGKDSEKHRHAGAVGSLVVSNRELQLQLKYEKSPSLENLVKLYDSFEIDVLVVEGYKREGYEKLLILREKEDLTLLDECTNIQAVVCWNTEEYEILRDSLCVPVFHITEETRYISWLMERCMR